MSKIITVNQNELDKFEKLALASPRKRHLHMLHTSHEAHLHTMINTFTKGTYARPHRHYAYDNSGNLVQKGESFVALRGSGKILSFDDAGNVVEVIRLDASLQSMCWIPSQVWHTVVPDSAIFTVYENKTGPWEEATDKCFHPLFPDENDQERLSFIEAWDKL